MIRYFTKLCLLIAVLVTLGSVTPVMAQQGTADGLYVAENNQPVGPLTHAQVEARVKSGQLTAQSLVWMQGMADWVQADTIPAVQQLLAGQTVPTIPETRDYKAFLDGTWLSDPIQSPLDGIGLATTQTRIEFNKLGSFNYFETMEVPTNYNVPLRSESKGQGTFTISEASPAKFRIAMKGDLQTTSTGGHGVPTVGAIEVNTLLQVVDDNTIVDNGVTWRRIN